MTNRDKQLIEASIVQGAGQLTKAGKIVTVRYGDNVLKYSWDEQNGYKFEWSIPEKWYIAVFPLAYYLYCKRGKEVYEYRMSYRIDPRTLQPVLLAESYPSYCPGSDWENQQHSYAPNDRELEAIKQSSK